MSKYTRFPLHKTEKPTGKLRLVWESSFDSDVAYYAAQEDRFGAEAIHVNPTGPNYIPFIHLLFKRSNFGFL